MAAKTQFLTRSTDAVVELGNLYSKLKGLAGVYASRGYNTGGAKALTDQDLKDAGIDMTVAEFNSTVVPLIGSVIALIDGPSSIQNKTWFDVINIARKDI